MRCSCGATARIASLGLNCFFGGAVSCMWCVCCCRRFASLDSTASWRGCPMQSNATVELPFDRHKAVMDITFAAWCEVNIEFVEWLLCEAVDAMFCLRYVRKNVRRYVRKHVKRYVRKNVRRYVRKNFRRYVRKNVKRYVRKNVRRFAVSRCVFMTEAGSEELKLWSGERCGNTDACLMWATLVLYACRHRWCFQYVHGTTVLCQTYLYLDIFRFIIITCT